MGCLNSQQTSAIDEVEFPSKAETIKKDECKDLKAKINEKFSHLQNYDQNHDLVFVEKAVQNDSPVFGSPKENLKLIDSIKITKENYGELNKTNGKNRIELEKSRAPTILNDVNFNHFRNINSNLVESVMSDNFDCQNLDTQISKKSSYENNDMPVNNDFQMILTVKSQDVSALTDLNKNLSDNNEPSVKNKGILDAKKAKIMNYGNKTEINKDLTKSTSFQKLNDYFNYSNNLKAFNFTEQRKILQKCININELIKLCENNMLGQLKRESSLNVENVEMDEYNTIIKEKTRGSRTSQIKKKMSLPNWNNNGIN